MTEKEKININGKEILLEPRFYWDYDECYCDRLIKAFPDDYEELRFGGNHDRQVIMRRDGQEFSTRDENYLTDLGLELTMNSCASNYFECSKEAIEKMKIEIEGQELFYANKEELMRIR